MAYAGIVRDSESGAPIPSATVALYDNGRLVAQSVADGGGSFVVGSSVQSGDILIFSSAGYKSASYPADNLQRSFSLDRNVLELEPVELNNRPKTGNILMWALIALAVYKMASNGKK